jgi:hypothetical protein
MAVSVRGTSSGRVAVLDRLGDGQAVRMGLLLVEERINHNQFRFLS